MKEYPEQHAQGTISIESGPEELDIVSTYLNGDLGIQISKDGRVWVCINEIAFLRFTPISKTGGYHGTKT